MRVFEYPLESVLKQHEWEIDALKAELMVLNQALRERQAEMHRINECVQTAEQEISNICRENAIIARGQKTIVELYLREQRAGAQDKQQQIDQARALVERVFVQLSRKKQSQRGIERHRERKKKDFDADAIRRAALETDDLWLARLAGAK